MRNLSSLLQHRALFLVLFVAAITLLPPDKGSCQPVVAPTSKAILPSVVKEGAPLNLVFIGDSNEYGTGCFNPEYQSYVSLIGMYLYFQNQPYVVVNAGIPGDTTLGVLGRLDQYLNKNTAIIFLHIGLNDIYYMGESLEGRHPPLDNFKKGLNAIVEKVKAKGTPLVLMRNNVPQTTDYFRQFVGVYDEVARKYRVPIIDSWDLQVALAPGMRSPDGHFNENGHRAAAYFILRQLNPAFTPSEEELMVSNDMIRMLPWFQNRWERN